MSVKVELPPEVEAHLAAQAAAEGISLPEYLRHLLEEQASADTGSTLSPAERAAAWRESVKGLPVARRRSPTRPSAGRASTTRAAR